MTISVTSNILRTFEIEDACPGTYLCNHVCTTTLNDGTKHKSRINGATIFFLIQHIGKDRVVGNHQHFNFFEARNKIVIEKSTTIECSPISQSVYDSLFT